MKRISILLGLITISTLYTSCEAWEDDSFHPGDQNGPAMKLKEIVTTNDDIVSKDVYSYNSDDKISSIKSYANIEDLTSYTEVIYTYPTDSKIVLTSKTYINNTLNSESTVETTFTNSEYTITMSTNGDLVSTITGQYNLPCGTSTNTIDIPEFDITQTQNYQYTDNNCSYKMTVDGDLVETTTKDNKRTPFTDPTEVALGFTSHNIIKTIDHMDDSITEYVYTYNQNNYPEEADVTVTEGNENYTYHVSYTYY